jgi:hypothetical protein
MLFKKALTRIKSCQPFAASCQQTTGPMFMRHYAKQKSPPLPGDFALSFSYCLFFFVEAHCFFSSKEQFILFFATYDHVLEFT